MSRVLEQIARAGYLPYLSEWERNGDTMIGMIHPSAVELLKADARFANGIFYGLHRDVGKNLIDFRSYNGELGEGSLQLVIDRRTGRFYADIDAHNPYQDVARVVGHLFGEVVPNAIRKLFRRRT
jgi:hypothetical protein